MSNKKESSLQVVAALLGIIASVVALHDWYDKRAADAPQHSAAAMFRLPASSGGAEQKAGPVTEAPSALEVSPSTAPQGLSVPASSAPATTSAPAVPVASPVTATASAPAPSASAVPTASARPASSVAAPAGANAPAAADPFMALVNAPADSRVGVAAAIRGEGVARLLSGLEQRGVNVTRDFFRGGFTQSSHFDQLLSGDGSALRRSGALAAGGRVLVGELQVSYQPAEMNLVVCDVSFSYVVFNARGSRVARGTAEAFFAGDDRTSALNEAIARLLAEHGATLARAAGG